MKFRVRFGVLLGNVLHHYDISLFGWVAPFLAPILFPQKGEMEALLTTFAFIPLSYLTQPLGALFWGWIGDRYGRKPVLVATLIGVAVSSAAIGCLPLSSGAWIYLALCRIFQGFFSAGEKKGAALFLLEHTANSKRAWSSALYDASGIVGIFVASLLATYWGAHWRALFWFAAATGLVAMFLRNRAEESPEYSPISFSWIALWKERLALLKVTIVSGFSYANYFLITIFLNGYLPQITSLTKQDTMLFNTHLLWIDFLLLLGFGLLCRWIQKEKLMAAGALTAAIVAIPLFMALEGASWAEAAAVRLALVLCGVALAAPYHAWQLEVLPKERRLLIGAVGSTLGAKFFGAPIPVLATWLATKTGCAWAAALPIVVLGLAAGAVVLQKGRSSSKLVPPVQP